MSKLKVVIAEDHDVVVKGYMALINLMDDVTISKVFTTGVDLVKYCKDHSFDILILDLEMPRFDGIQVLEYLKKNKIEIKVLVSSAHYSNEFIEEMKSRYNVKGFLTKAGCHDDLGKAIINISQGGNYFPSNSSITEESKYLKDKMLAQQLSDRELELLPMIEFYSYKEIAYEKGISLSSVKTYFRRVREKLGLNDNLELIKLLTGGKK